MLRRGGATMGRTLDVRKQVMSLWCGRMGRVAALSLLACGVARVCAAQVMVSDAGAAGSAEAVASVPSAPAAEAALFLRGTVMDTGEAAVPGATVTLVRDGSGEEIRAESDSEGVFALRGVSPGAYQLKVERAGFEAWSHAEVLSPGQPVELGEIALAVSATSSTVEVRASAREIAEAQVQLEERQRVLGVFPNFYASYVHNAEPLAPAMKMHLAWRFAGDPVAFAMAGVVAGSEQRANTFSAYGPGAPGYMKRFGAAYTDGLTSTVLGQAVLPMLLHQDPRYFVKGTGSIGSRALYAMGSMVICKGDDRRWQMNYSNVLGNFASASISNLYYPAASRGAGLVVQNALTATALGAVGGLFQEFLLHRMTPNVPDYGAAGE